MVRAEGVGGHQFRKRAGQVGRRRGRHHLVADHGHFPSFRTRTDHGLDEIVSFPAPAGVAEQAGGADDEMAVPGRTHQVLAGKLGRAVDVQGQGQVILPVRPVRRAVEDEIRADVHQLRPVHAAGHGQVPGAEGIDGEGLVGMGLALVDPVVRRGIDHRIGPAVFQQAVHAVFLGNVEFVVRTRNQFVFRQRTLQVRTQLSPGTGYEDAHRIRPIMVRRPADVSSQPPESVPRLRRFGTRPSRPPAPCALCRRRRPR